MSETITEAIAHGPGVALVAPADGRRVSYEALLALQERIAAQLAAAGVKPGDVVAGTFGNGTEVVAAFLGVLRAGAAFAPLNASYTEQEFTAYLEDLSPAAMLFGPDAGEPARAACAALGIATHDCDAEGLRDVEPGELPAPPEPDFTALVLHTSGTTSKPKGVYLRHRNLAASMRTIVDCYALTADDVAYCVMPLFHVHGLVASTLSTLAAGGTVVIPPKFSASRFWSDVVDHGATWFTAVPTIHRTILLHAARNETPAEHGLRFARSCSSALAPSVWREFEERFGIPLTEAYGMTEASHQMASNPLPPGERRPGSVGLPTGVDVAILDDDWQPLAAEQIGEVSVRGPSVVDAYRGNEAATAAAFRDGWFRTGDQGRLTGDGYLVLEGRLKELINRGGEKISPHEVEDALLSHPSVTEAVAFAAPDEKYGEVVAAVVVAADGGLDVEAVTTHCHEHLSSFKVPAQIHVVDEIPKGPTGKIQRRRMAELI